jgi:predicted amidohydrolase YtcJ
LSSKANLVIKNAHIFTAVKTNPYAEAVAIKDNRIVYVGYDTGAQLLCDDNTRIVDGHGHTVTPGFIDTHVHLLSGATWMGYAELSNANNKYDVKSILREYAEKNPSAEWIIGWRIQYDIISTRQQLDAIIADRPVYVRAADAHTAWANTKALELAGILNGDEAVEICDMILRDENGIATGELREGAIKAVLNIIPPPNEMFVREQLKRAVQGFNQTGITSIHNMNGDMKDLMVYAAAEDAGELNLRVYVPYRVTTETQEQDLKEAAEMANIQGEYVRGGAVKFFMDGVWESYTAYNIEPYADDQAINVDPIFSLQHFTRMASACDKMGLQIAVHCCGDAAVRQTLDGYEAVQKANGRRDSRHRIEHVEVCYPEDMPRFKELGVIASVQLSHAPTTLEESGVAQFRLGAQRWQFWQPWRDLKNAGALLSLGSDWTVVPFDPMTHIYVALNREKLSPDSRDQRLTLEECLIGYTRDAAYVEFKEYEKGQVKEGYLADLVLFSHDLFQVKSEDIMGAKVVMTIFDGRIVYEAQ